MTRKGDVYFKTTDIYKKLPGLLNYSFNESEMQRGWCFKPRTAGAPRNNIRLCNAWDMLIPYKLPTIGPIP